MAVPRCLGCLHLRNPLHPGCNRQRCLQADETSTSDWSKIAEVTSFLKGFVKRSGLTIFLRNSGWTTTYEFKPRRNFSGAPSARTPLQLHRGSYLLKAMQPTRL